MKKSDVLIATTLGLLVSAAAIWFAQPKWYKDLAEEFREWRKPRRPAMYRYIERQRIRREEQEENERNGNLDLRTERTRYDGAESAPKITFAVIDATTKEPVKAFRYRRYFDARRPGDLAQEIPRNDVSNDSGTFQIAIERTFQPVERPSNRTVAQTELWKISIENETQKRRAQSDTLEVSAEGFHEQSIPLFEMMNAQQALEDQTREFRLLRLDATPEDFKRDAQIREVLEQQEAEKRYEELVRSKRKEAQLVVPEDSRARLHGTVTFNGKPPREGVILFSNAMVSDILEVPLGPDGSYNAEALMAGTNRLTVRATQDGAVWQEHRETITLRTEAPNEYSYDLASTGTLTGSVTGLHDGESGGIFAIKGDYVLSNVTEDDLYDFGDICDGEARVNKEGAFTIRELEKGKYTIIAIAERHTTGEGASFLFITDTVEIMAGEEASIALSLN